MPFCTCCGNDVHERAVACPKCGVPPKAEKNHCRCCGEKLHNPNQVMCVKCGTPITQSTNDAALSSTLGTATLVIEREDTWIGCAGSYQIHVDGQIVGQVANGKTMAFTVSPGKHKISFFAWKIKITKCLTYVFEDGKTIHITVRAGWFAMDIISVQHYDSLA